MASRSVGVNRCQKASAAGTDFLTATTITVLVVAFQVCVASRGKSPETTVKPLAANVAASATGLTGVNSSNFAISDFGNAAQLRFVGPPINDQHSTGTNEWKSAPVVYVQDSANNLVVNDSSTQVTLQLFQKTGGSDNVALMGASTKTAVNGIADFTGLGMRLSELNVTNIVLKATSDNGLTPGQSQPFAGNLSTTAGLRVSAQPVNGIKTTTAGTCWVSSNPTTITPIKVDVIDSDGNTITADNATVLTITACSTTCSPTGGVSVTVQNGVGTFNGLQVTDNKPNTVLTITASGGQTATTQAFNVPVCTP